MPVPAPQPAERTVRVDVPDHPYDVRIGAGLLSSLGGSIVGSAIAARGAHVMIAHDAALPDSLVTGVRASLESSGFRVSTGPLIADETQKTLARAEILLRTLAQSKHERHHPLIALGGGLVGDLAGFAAAIYRRGIPFIQCPTTLLSMVDASVGGKTGVNLSVGDSEDALIKNVVGAFHQPRLVIADTSSLASLPDRHFRSGLAECIKHGLLSAEFGDPDLFAWTAAALDRIIAKEPGALIEVIHRNVSVKASVVRGDERELLPEGGRALLNLGHTFAHAIETLAGPKLTSGESPLLHGEAVALGLVAAAMCSAKLGTCPAALPDQVRALLHRAGLPSQLRGLPDSASLIARMGHDKKVERGSLRLVLPTGSGRCIIRRDPPLAALAAAWDAIRA